MSGVLDFSRKRTILVVDDIPENLSVISGILKEHFQVKAAPSGERCLQISFSDDAADLILLDIMMPEMDGYEVLRRLQADPRTEGIPVIFVTAVDQAEDEQKGIDLGAVDYVTKPVNPAILLARVRNHLLLKEARDFLKEEKRSLERQIGVIENVAIQAFASLAETRNDEPINHTRRMQWYVKALADRLKDHPRFSAFLNEETIDLLFRSVPLHDIGKVGIPDHVLLKDGPLDENDMAIMRNHTVIGSNAILRAQQALGANTEFLKYAREIAYSHHEKWNGEGYPQGLRGEKIPISARLTALSDVYDILISHRPHKPPIPHQEAVQIIAAARGVHFDPDVVDAFIEVQHDFAVIATRHADITVSDGEDR